MADPSDAFLNAYMGCKKGEKLEAEGNAKAALAAFEQAISQLDQISKQSPTWSPLIVEHRRQLASEAVSRLAPLAGKTGATKPAKSNEDELIGVLPDDKDEPLIPGTESFVPRESAPARSSAKGGNPLQEIQRQLDSLQDDLSKTKQKLERVTREKEELAKKYDGAVKDAEESTQKVVKLEKRANMLEDALVKQEGDVARNSDVSKQMRADLAAVRKQLDDVRIERDAEAELREQVASRLAAANGKIANVSKERDAARQQSASVPGQLAEMQKELDKAITARVDITGKLEKSQGELAKVQGERDDALQQVAKMKEAQKQVDKLMADNTQLMAKLGEAETQIKSFKAVGLEKDKQIAALKTEISGVNVRLADTVKQSAAYQAQMSELQVKLDVQAKELAHLKSDATTSAADRKRLVEENDLLRGVVVRQMKQQAVRDKTKQLVLTELAKLAINSKALVEQVEFLGQPVVKLTEKEKKLFKQPTIEISEAEISIAAPKELSVNDKVPAEGTPEGVPAETKANGEAAPMKEVTAAEPIEARAGDPARPAAEPSPSDSDAGLPRVDLAGPPASAGGTPSAQRGKGNGAKSTTTVVKNVGQPPAEGELPSKAGSKTKPIETQNTIASKPITVLEEPGEMPKANVPATPSNPPGQSASASNADSPTGKGGGSGSVTAAGLPVELLADAQDAKEKFEKGEYRDAEKVYEKILTKAPNNLYVLSNLGVVRFRAGKLKMAEESFRKAIAIDPDDSFSRCTLGIVYYSQSKYDEAINELTKALMVNPKNATAHNYLGITASQKGWQDNARKELETATTLDPQYADAHFNLAVVLATQQPANKETARKHYKLATELGAEPDSALELLIK